MGGDGEINWGWRVGGWAIFIGEKQNLGKEA